MSKAKDDCYALIQEISVASETFCQAPECNQLSDCGHHIYGRDNMATAFLPEAVIGLCTRCHTGFAHNKPKGFKRFMIERMGEDRYYELKRLSDTTAKHQDYKAIREGLREILRNIKDEPPY